MYNGFFFVNTKFAKLSCANNCDDGGKGVKRPSCRRKLFVLGSAPAYKYAVLLPCPGVLQSMRADPRPGARYTRRVWSKSVPVQAVGQAVGHLVPVSRRQLICALFYLRRY